MLFEVLKIKINHFIVHNKFRIFQMILYLHVNDF